MRDPTATRLLRELLRGRGAHVDPLAAVEGLDPELAGRRLAGAEHTIWQLVWHMNYWLDYEVRSLEGPEVAYPEHAAASWPPEPSPASAADWLAAMERFRALLERMDDWARAIAEDAAVGRRPVHPGKEEDALDVLWQMVAHTSYHTGQVALLRRAFGAWPPAGGGDTW
jgi:uncharacterized damage-inducible protein DinB